MSKPVVAVVGRPNVGKSTLFNRLVGRRISIVDNTPGVTRDRIYGDCDWNGRTFSLVDTGGIEPDSTEEIPAGIRAQAKIAVDASDVILFVTDLTTGVTAADEEIAVLLRKSGKPVILCVNKCDSIGSPPPEFYEFYSLGLGDPVPISSVHGHGTGDLLDLVTARLPEAQGEETKGEPVHVAVIGKPNAGKSSLVNRIAGENRMMVSGTAGTTRDAVDIAVENSYGRFILIDTAGLRRKSRIEGAVERYSVMRAAMAVERSDVCVILIDATVGFTEQDSKIAGMAHEAGKGSVIAVNKWDAVEKDEHSMTTARRKLEQDFSFMSYAPIVFISAKTGLRIGSLFEAVNAAAKSNATRISTGKLNEVLSEATERVQPPTDKGRRLKIYYMTQVSVRPPTFVFFVNSKALFHFSYQRYLENIIRETFELTGTPVRFIVRERGERRGEALS